MHLSILVSILWSQCRVLPKRCISIVRREKSGINRFLLTLWSLIHMDDYTGTEIHFTCRHLSRRRRRRRIRRSPGCLDGKQTSRTYVIECFRFFRRILQKVIKINTMTACLPKRPRVYHLQLRSVLETFFNFSNLPFISRFLVKGTS